MICQLGAGFHWGSTGLILGALALFALPHAPPASQTVAPSSFVGTWVGNQSWALESPSPGAKEEQSVTLTLELIEGRLVGTLTPFLGGGDGATIVDAKIVGDQLQASAVVGKPRPGPPAPGPPGTARGGRGWKEAVQIEFAFKADRNSLTGTADVSMDNVKWLKFKYDLSRKRSRY